jgi:hypothetical protein
LAELLAAAPLGRAEVDTEIANREADLLAATKNVTLAEDTFKQLVLRDPTAPEWRAAIMPTDEPSFDLTPSDLDGALKQARANRPELRNLRLQEEINQIDLQYASNQTRPRVDIVSTVSTTGLAGGAVSTTPADITSGLAGNTLVNGQVPLITGDPASSANAFLLSQINQLRASQGLPAAQVPLITPSQVNPNLVGGYAQTLRNLSTLGTNTVAVVDAIRKLLPTFREQLPASVRLDVLYDRSDSIRESVGDVEFTLLLAIVLVVLVIFIFLRNVRATIIPTLALPTSIVATFAVMYLLNFSLDNLSLMALTLSVGFVVDDAVVMLENIVRHIEAGEGVMGASLRGSREIGFTILSMTISLVAVFIPVLFMGGILGRLFKEFAITISVAILVSGFVSLSLMPMLCSRLLKAGQVRESALHEGGTHARRRGWWNFTETAFGQVLRAYEWTLKIVLRHSLTTVLVLLLLACVTVYLFTVVPKGFIPSDDNGTLTASTEAAQGISFQDMMRHQQALADIIQRDPNVATVGSTAGAGGRNSGGNTGTVFIGLKPLNQRKLSADQVIEELRPKLSHEPGVRIFMQNPPSIRVGGVSSRSLYQVTLQATNISDLYNSVSVLEKAMHGLSSIQDVNTDVQR